MKKFLIIVEETETGYSAFSPNVPGCGSTGQTKEEVERNIQEAIEFHLEGFKGRRLPNPRADEGEGLDTISGNRINFRRHAI